jgi:hypothetical protein
MPYHRLAHCLFLPICLLPLAVGCQVFSDTRPVTVLARDADTKQPIPGAQVVLAYPLANSVMTPGAATATTGEKGLAQMSATPYADNTLMLTVSAKDYITENQCVPLQTVQAIEPDHLFKSIERKSPNLIVELYAENPYPTVELVVPTGYRGPLHVEMRIPDDAPMQPGQRMFQYEMAPSGDVLITGPAVLRRFPFPEFTAKYANGTPLPQNAQGAEVGLWWKRSTGNHYYFLVGTAVEAARSRDLGDDGMKSSLGSTKGQSHGKKSKLPDPGGDGMMSP